MDNLHRSDPIPRMLIGIARIQRRKHTQKDILYYCRAYGTTWPQFLDVVRARYSASFARRVRTGVFAADLAQREIIA